MVLPLLHSTVQKNLIHSTAKWALLLQQTLDDCATNKNVRAIYITGNGKAFCAGQDLAELINENGPGIEKILSEHYNPIVSRIRKIEKPVICAVNGVAAGAGVQTLH